VSNTIAPTGRAIIKDDGDILEITIPAKGNHLLVVIMIIGIFLWSIVSVVLGETEAGILAALLCFYLGYFILWMFKGKEIITVSAEQLSIRREVMGLGRTRCYQKDNIEILSIAPEYSDFYLPLFSFESGYVGPIWFRQKKAPSRHFSPSQSLFGMVNFSVIRFGFGLDLQETKDLVRRIKSRLGLED
jgi:hypothetical protein